MLQRLGGKTMSQASSWEEKRVMKQTVETSAWPSVACWISSVFWAGDTTEDLEIRPKDSMSLASSLCLLLIDCTIDQRTIRIPITKIYMNIIYAEKNEKPAGKAVYPDSPRTTYEKLGLAPLVPFRSWREQYRYIDGCCTNEGNTTWRGISFPRTRFTLIVFEATTSTHQQTIKDQLELLKILQEAVAGISEKRVNERCWRLNFSLLIVTVAINDSNWEHLRLVVWM